MTATIRLVQVTVAVSPATSISCSDQRHVIRPERVELLGKLADRLRGNQPGDAAGSMPSVRSDISIKHLRDRALIVERSSYATRFLIRTVVGGFLVAPADLRFLL